MATINITGILKAPMKGYVLSNSSIKFIAIENYFPVVKGSTSIYRSALDGSYNFDVHYGTYAVYILDGASWDLLGKVNITANLPSILNLANLVNTVEPLVAAEISLVQDILAQIEVLHSEVVADREEVRLDLVSTNQDTIDTAADRVQTGLDRVQTGLDRDATNQDTIDTSNDLLGTNADLVATNQDTIDTAADLVQTNQDTIDTAADRVQTELDRVATNQDSIDTNDDLVSITDLLNDTANTDNWNTAHSWGDHSVEDYAIFKGFKPDNRHEKYNGDLNNIEVNSIYNISAAEVTHMPTEFTSWGFVHTMLHSNSTAYATQICYSMNSGDGEISMRHKQSNTWGTWKVIGTGRTIAISGDATGSATVDGDGSTDIAVTVNDDSHNHVVSNIDGLQTELNGKVDDNQVLTNVPSGAIFTDTVYTLPSTISSDTTGNAATASDADKLDGLNSTQFVRSDQDDTINGNLTIDNGTSTNLNVVADPTGVASLNAIGGDQGIAVTYAGQSLDHGGGIFYNGDGSPSYANGEVADRVSLFRRSSGTNTVVMSYLHSNNDVVFTGKISGDGSGLTGTASLRATGTTKVDVGLGSVDNYSRSHYDSRYLATNAKAEDADKLDGLSSTQFVRSDTGTISDGRLPNVISSNITTTNGAELLIAAGESLDSMGSFGGEVVHIAGESGVKVYAANNLLGGLDKETTLIDVAGNADFGGEVNAVSFKGNGSNLTNVNADKLDGNDSTVFARDATSVDQDSSTGVAKIPKGTTSQRPNVPVASDFRYNTETNEFEGYGSEWGSIGGGSSLQVTDEVITQGQDWDGVPYTDPDAIGANATAKIYPDGSIVGSTDNGSYVAYANGKLVMTRYETDTVFGTGIDRGGFFFSPQVDFPFPHENVGSAIGSVSNDITSIGYIVNGIAVDGVDGGEWRLHLIRGSNFETGQFTGAIELIAHGFWK